MLKQLIFLILIVNSLAYQKRDVDYAPVDTLNLDQYVGRWYQMYQDLPDYVFVGKSTCIIADYSMKNETTVGVINSDTSVKGELEQIEGIAYYEDGNYGGQLTVKLQDLPSAPYWVVALGPVENNMYQYSIVSDDKKVSLFVLARNVTEFYQKYDSTVLKELDNLGFNTIINKPIPTNQDNCIYP